MSCSRYNKIYEVLNDLREQKDKKSKKTITPTCAQPDRRGNIDNTDFLDLDCIEGKILKYILKLFLKYSVTNKDIKLIENDILITPILKEYLNNVKIDLESSFNICKTEREALFKDDLAKAEYEKQIAAYNEKKEGNGNLRRVEAMYGDWAWGMFKDESGLGITVLEFLIGVVWGIPWSIIFVIPSIFMLPWYFIRKKIIKKSNSVLRQIKYKIIELDALAALFKIILEYINKIFQKIPDKNIPIQNICINGTSIKKTRKHKKCTKENYIIYGEKDKIIKIIKNFFNTLEQKIPEIFPTTEDDFIKFQENLLKVAKEKGEIIMKEQEEILKKEALDQVQISNIKPRLYRFESEREAIYSYDKTTDTYKKNDLYGIKYIYIDMRNQLYIIYFENIDNKFIIKKQFVTEKPGSRIYEFFYVVQYENDLPKSKILKTITLEELLNNYKDNKHIKKYQDITLLMNNKYIEEAIRNIIKLYIIDIFIINNLKYDNKSNDKYIYENIKDNIEKATTMIPEKDGKENIKKIINKDLYEEIKDSFITIINDTDFMKIISSINNIISSNTDIKEEFDKVMNTKSVQGFINKVPPVYRITLHITTLINKGEDGKKIIDSFTKIIDQVYNRSSYIKDNIQSIIDNIKNTFKIYIYYAIDNVIEAVHKEEVILVAREVTREVAQSKQDKLQEQNRLFENSSNVALNIVKEARQTAATPNATTKATPTAATTKATPTAATTKATPTAATTAATTKATPAAATKILTPTSLLERHIYIGVDMIKGEEYNVYNINGKEYFEKDGDLYYYQEGQLVPYNDTGYINVDEDDEVCRGFEEEEEA